MDERSDIQLAGTLRAPRAARKFVREALREWALDGFGYLTELLTDELVSNSVHHVGGAIGLRAIRLPTAIRVEVSDESAELPVVLCAGPHDPRGRGMQIVDGLAHRWGVRPTGGGKTVWFELDVPGSNPRHSDEHSPTRAMKDSSEQGPARDRARGTAQHRTPA